MFTELEKPHTVRLDQQNAHVHRVQDNLKTFNIEVDFSLRLSSNTNGKVEKFIKDFRDQAGVLKRNAVMNTENDRSDSVDCDGIAYVAQRFTGRVESSRHCRGPGQTSCLKRRTVVRSTSPVGIGISAGDGQLASERSTQVAHTAILQQFEEPRGVLDMTRNGHQG